MESDRSSVGACTLGNSSIQRGWYVDRRPPGKGNFADFSLPDFLLFKQLPSQGNKTFEAYHTWMWVPIIQEDGTYGGLWNATINTTTKVLAERRLATVREMGERTCG
jgi:hypothetical protein